MDSEAERSEVMAVQVDPKDLEFFSNEVCEKWRAEGKAKSGPAGLSEYPFLKDKKSFEDTVQEALEHYPRAQESVVRQYLVCLAEGYYGSNPIPFNPYKDEGGSVVPYVLGLLGAGALGWWILKPKERK